LSDLTGFFSTRVPLIRASRLAAEVTVHPDGHRHDGPPIAPVTPEQLERAAQAADLLAAARAQAETLVRQGARQVAQDRQAAHDEGYAYGYAAGQSAARAEVAEALELVRNAAAQGAAIRDRVVARAEPELIELVVASLRALLGELVLLEPDLVRHTLRQALARAAGQQVVRVRVHPDDVEVLHAEADLITNAPPWEVLPDGSIGVGGCVVETAAGEIDARLDAQLAEIARVFRAAAPGAARDATRNDWTERAPHAA